MKTSISTTRTGSFVLLGVAALVAGIFLVGSQEGLFHPTFQVSAYFTSVEGVRPGSAVRMAGVDIGTVDNIEVSPSDARVRVHMELDSRMQGFIKTDSYATIVPEGLVGNYYVDVAVRSRTGGQIEDGGIIHGRDATRLSTVLDTTFVILENIRIASNKLNDILTIVQQGHGTLGKFISSDDIYTHLENMSSRADSGLNTQLDNIERLSGAVQDVVQKADTLLTNANAVVARVNDGSGTIGALLRERTLYDSLLLGAHNTVQATEEAKVGARRFAENMNALKHNWFFKGYFEDRGYWDEADYEKELDKKIDSLKTLQRTVTGQMEELKRIKEPVHSK
jgi:phospholipid/cholesterol/gamma-HCH transport system substrate-binding protein